VIGARKFLVAYNVDLNTVDQRLATKIAGEIREKGRKRLDAAGKPVRDAAGEEVWDPGLLEGIKAVGWTIPEFGCAQISINVTDLDATPFNVARHLRRACPAHGCASPAPSWSACCRATCC
jgi:glutamate formiminotransferase/formiminotetrahydrofolate cyclodeaminase